MHYVLLLAPLALVACGDPCAEVSCGDNEVCDADVGDCVCADDAFDVDGECVVYDFDYKLVGHYPLDGDGTAAVGESFASDGVQATEDHAGNAGGAVLFDGEAELSMEVQDYFADPFATEAWTVSMWLRVDQISDDPMTFFYGVPNRPWFFYDNRDSRLKVSYVEDLGSTHVVESGLDPIEIGTWHHVFILADGAQISWYIDDDYSDGGEFLLMDDGDVVEYLMGATKTDGQGLVGAMDDLRIWDRAVPPDELHALYSTF